MHRESNRLWIECQSSTIQRLRSCAQLPFERFLSDSAICHQLNRDDVISTSVSPTVQIFREALKEFGANGIGTFERPYFIDFDEEPLCLRTWERRSSSQQSDVKER